ncbi:hypothetical protein KK120_12535 [Virgibacillus dakarensis]|nr:hypothetical protein [Virgibacillus dakarensis]
MIGFLFFISFLLHITALIAIYQLVKQNKAAKQTNMDEIIGLFETYLAEIKEENRLLETKLGDNDTMESKEEKKQAEAPVAPVEKGSNKLNDFFVPEVKDSLETSLQARVLKLHDQGVSHEEIASRLNCGKTEAALIIKLHAETNNNA